MCVVSGAYPSALMMKRRWPAIGMPAERRHQLADRAIVRTSCCASRTMSA
jgi:hypothetical protein